jgi:hypothetical protein
MRSAAKDIDWMTILEPGSIDETWEQFCKKIYELGNKYVPIVRTGGSKKK